MNIIYIIIIIYMMYSMVHEQNLLEIYIYIYMFNDHVSSV